MIKECEVNFPFEPYEVQADFVSTMVNAILGGDNAALESHTGTGKTLCMLTAALVAVNKLREVNDQRHQIVYASRTFTQL